MGYGGRCHMFGDPTIRACSGNFRGVSAHAFISEMESLGVWLCRENKNILKLVVN